jgi:hypothetical protein
MRGRVVGPLAYATLWVCILMQAGACTLQRVSRDAAEGAIEALAPPGREEEFSRIVQELSFRLAKQALEAAPPPGPEELARDSMRGFLTGLETHMADPRNRQWLRELVRAAVAEALITTRRELRGELSGARPLLTEAGQGFTQGLVSGLAAEQQALADITGTVGRSLAQALSEQIRLELRAQLSDPALLGAVEQVARRASAAAVEGATSELGRTLPACGEGVEGPCIQQLTAQVSRSALAGLLRAVWPVALLAAVAFGLGVLVAAVVRRRPLAPQR